MDLVIAIGLLIIGFVVLIKGADLLVEGASAIAKKFNISDIIIGLTIVSFGTSAPELVVNIGASIGGNNGMVFGNVLGSNIFNTCLILGIAGLIYPLAVQRNTAFKELPFSFFIILLVFALGNDVMLFGAAENTFSRIDGLILLGLFGAFLYYVYSSAKNDPAAQEEGAIESMPMNKSLIYVATGMVGLVIGGQLVLDNAVFMASQFGMTDRVIGLTVVAIGTSLPELATSAVAAMKKNSDIAVGNVIGSNIFNVLLVLSMSTAIAPTTYDTASNFDIYFLLGATVLLTIFLFIGTKSKGGRFTVDRWQALILLLAVVDYTVYVVVGKDIFMIIMFLIEST
ncbi:MAG: calcium/sodium antiporter [Aureispira sp.]|nr:calcium/sodium antiporter [Aureispira sp.]